MKRFLSVLLVLTFVFLCGCSAEKNDTSATATTTAPEHLGFAATTVLEDEVLTFRVLSETYDENGGITYDLEFQNHTNEALTLTLSGTTFNDQPSTAAVSLTLDKNTTTTSELNFTADETQAATAKKIGVHLKATSKTRWYEDTVSEHDLVFYPVAPNTTATK